MRPVVRRLPLLLVILAALALAGCASPTAPTTTTPSDVAPPAQITTAQASDLLKGAITQLPDQFGVDLHVMNGSLEVVTMKALFDNVSETGYIEMTASPEFLARDPEAGAMGAMFPGSFAMYISKDASVMLVNGTAIAFPADGKTGSKALGSDPTSSFKDLAAPSKLFENFTANGGADNSTVVKSVTPTVYRGHPALEILASTTQDGKTYDAKAIVFTDPTLLARLEGNFPPEAEQTGSPFDAGTVAMDFFYGAEVKTKVPDKITRAAGLAYTSGAADAMSDMFGSHDGMDTGGSSSSASSTEATWTFLHSGGIKLSEAIVEIKNASSSGDSPMGMASPDLGAVPTLWSMPLDAGTKEKDGVKLVFHDHDNDGLVSANDTLTLTWPEDQARPQAVLKDSVTGLYIVPGAPLVIALGLVAIMALALRRRA